MFNIDTRLLKHVCTRWKVNSLIVTVSLTSGCPGTITQLELGRVTASSPHLCQPHKWMSGASPLDQHSLFCQSKNGQYQDLLVSQSLSSSFSSHTRYMYYECILVINKIKLQTFLDRKSVRVGKECH